MYPELAKYKEIKQQYEEQLNRLKIEQGDLEEDKEEMLRQYEELLGKVGLHQQSESKNEEVLLKLKTELQGLTEDLGDVMEESTHLSHAQKERLNEWMAPLQKGMEREVLAAKQHLKLKKEEFKRYRIELLLLVQQVYEIEEYIHDIHRSYSGACKEFLTDQEKRSMKLQAIQIRHNAKQMMEELQSDLDYVMKNGKMPAWFHEKVSN